MTPVAVDPLQPQVAARRAPVSHVHPPPPAGYGSLPPETPREGGDGPAAPSARLGARRANPCPPTWMPAAAARPPPHRGRRRPSAPRRPAPPDMAALRHRPGRGARARRRSGPPAPRMRLRRGRRRQRPGGPGGRRGARAARGPSGDRAGTGHRAMAASRRAGARFTTARCGVSRGFSIFTFSFFFFSLFSLLKRGSVFSPFSKLRGVFIFTGPSRNISVPCLSPGAPPPALGSPWGWKSPSPSGRACKPPPALTGDRRHASSLPSEKKMSTVIFNDD